MTERKSFELAANLASQSAMIPAVATCRWCETTAAALCVARTRCAAVVRFVDSKNGLPPGALWPGVGVASRPGNAPLVEAIRGAAGQGAGDAGTDAGLSENWCGLDPGENCKVTAMMLDPLAQPGDPALAMLAFVGGRSALLAEALIDPAREISLRVVIGESSANDDAPFSDPDAEALRAAMRRITLRARLAFVAPIGAVNEPLNQREAEVLESLTRGKTIRQIAGEMHRSTHTIHDYLKSMHRKIGVGSRAELIARAAGRCEPREIPEPDSARAVA